MRRPGGEIDVFQSHDPGTGSFGTIAMCVRDHINAASATAMWTTDTSFIPDGKYLNRLIVQGSILTTQRNECIRRVTGDWILFVDDDMVWTPDDVKRLYYSWKELQDTMNVPVIMGGLCHRRTPPHDPTMYIRTQPTSGPYRFLETWDTDIVEVDATGMAFLLIPVAALEKIGNCTWPPLEERLQRMPPPLFRWTGEVGEDMRFCEDAKAAGCRIFVDTRIDIGHVSEIIIRRKHFLQEIAGRDPEIEQAVREQNEPLGVKTLTACEAREMLGWS